MTIDKYQVSKQIDYRGEIADVALQVRATGISSDDARAADMAFDRFLDILSGGARQVIHEYRKTIPYSSDEEQVVRDAPDRFKAWDLYHASFPDSHRTRDSIRKKWVELHPMEETHKVPECFGKYLEHQGCRDNPCNDSSACSKATPRENERKKEAAIETLVPDEKAVPAADENPAVPEKTDQKTGGRVLGWTPEQRDLVSKCKTKEEAWQKFQEQFPGQRNENAVHQRFNKLKKAGKIAKKKTTRAAKPAYDNEPIININGLDEDLTTALPEKNPTRKERGVTKHHAAEKKSAATAREKINAAAQTIAAAKQGPEDTTPSTQPVDCVLVSPGTGNTNGIVSGIKVRQIDGRLRFHGLATVKRVNTVTCEALVDIGNGVEWIPCNKLAPAMQSNDYAGAVS